MGIEIRNAVIKSARISNDDHGLLTAWLDLDYGGTGQGFGGFALYLPKSFTHHGGPNYAGHFIWRVMEVAGVSDWAKLSGKTIRVKQEHSSVHAIGHIVKDDWFNPGDDFERMTDNDPLRDQLLGRAKYLRNQGEVKSPELMEKAAAAIGICQECLNDGCRAARAITGKE